MKPRDTGFLSDEESFTKFGEGISLAVVGSRSSVRFIIKIVVSGKSRN